MGVIRGLVDLSRQVQAFLDGLIPLAGDLLGQVLSSVLPPWAVTLVLMAGGIITLSTIVLVAFMYTTLLERKVVGRIQNRLGPNRVGPLGLLQPIADMVKMFTKEDLIPQGADRGVFNLAPLVVAAGALLIFAAIPVGRGLVGADLNVGLLFILAVSSTSVIGILMAGWASRNKYALLGAMRSAAQLVSYEIPQVLSAIGVLLLAGSMSMNEIVEAQGQIWFIVLQPLGFLIFFISGVSEVNRTPFDLPEAESEIVAGYHVEYSGMKFGLFQMAEFIATIGISAITVTLFLGGWQGPLLPGYFWFTVKTALLVFVFLWLRGTLPRLRVDQLMGFAWKALVPLSLVNILVTGLAMAIHPIWAVLVGGVAALILAGVTVHLYVEAVRLKTRPRFA